MTDEKITQLTNNTAPAGSDSAVIVDSGTVATQELLLGDLNLLPDGWMINGKISVTVAANNLTVAIKTKAGANPSATDPVSVWINGSFRRITAALSVTINAGANTFNAGSAELATKEVDYFAYLGWKASTSAVVLLVSRIPFATLYSDFSATATNEKYAAVSSAPASTDDCVVVGRFAATLSAGAGYTWSVPTFTSANLIQRPIYETRWLDWTPVHTGFSSSPTGTFKYRVQGRCYYVIYMPTTGTSNATGYTVTLPCTPGIAMDLLCRVIDNGAAAIDPGLIATSSASNTATIYKTLQGGSWTGSGTKYAEGEFFVSY
jgi:hypothetical protein